MIMILWTALSLALGLEIHGELVRGMPCIKRFHQLFCPVAGNNYPLERIEQFIDENKSLMRRMYGEFQTVSEYGTPSHEFFENGASSSTLGVGGGGTKRRSVTKRAANGTLLPPDQHSTRNNDNVRFKRQSFQNNQTSETGRMDACESKVEVLTPYWATNSAGKIRAIVNTQHFEQAIHQEMCAKPQTKRCMGDCGCEQKYKWHRLLAYDPDNDCKGIFMDWFLFPACCVCRCAPMFSGVDHIVKDKNDVNDFGKGRRCITRTPLKSDKFKKILDEKGYSFVHGLVWHDYFNMHEKVTEYECLMGGNRPTKTRPSDIFQPAKGEFSIKKIKLKPT